MLRNKALKHDQNYSLHIGYMFKMLPNYINEAKLLGINNLCTSTIVKVLQVFSWSVCGIWPPVTDTSHQYSCKHYLSRPLCIHHHVCRAKVIVCQSLPEDRFIQNCLSEVTSIEIWPVIFFYQSAKDLLMGFCRDWSPFWSWNSAHGRATRHWLWWCTWAECRGNRSTVVVHYALNCRSKCWAMEPALWTWFMPIFRLISPDCKDFC